MSKNTPANPWQEALVFINLPVKNLDASKKFVTQLGFSINPAFTDDTAACVVINEKIFVMLLTHDKMKAFTPKAIADARTSSEVLLSLSCSSRERVGEVMALALAAGAKRLNEPRDYGFMVQDGFEDLDGHIWELIWMDPVAAQNGPPQQ